MYTIYVELLILRRVYSSAVLSIKQIVIVYDPEVMSSNPRVRVKTCRTNSFTCR